ncbi:hypothetical protein Tco_0749098 [Tanacetum coccineum]|uniref:Uncharacterized protein n=1 Tax=Tanacetum coccineum TaxID=301880 RepID=A0ABQ4Z0H3_9ASTR
MLFMLLFALGIDQNIVNKDNYEFVQIRQSSRCLLLEPSIGDNLTLGRSSSKHSTLEVGQISHQFLVVDNGSLSLICLAPDNLCTSVARATGADPVAPEVAWSPTLKANNGICICPLGSRVVVVTVVVIIVIAVVVVCSRRPAPTVLGQVAKFPAVSAFWCTRTVMVEVTLGDIRGLVLITVSCSPFPGGDKHKPCLCFAFYSAGRFDCSGKDHHTSFSFLPDVQHRHGSYPPSTQL